MTAGFSEAGIFIIVQLGRRSKPFGASRSGELRGRSAGRLRGKWCAASALVSARYSMRALLAIASTRSLWRGKKVILGAW